MFIPFPFGIGSRFASEDHTIFLCMVVWGSGAWIKGTMSVITAMFASHRCDTGCSFYTEQFL